MQVKWVDLLFPRCLVEKGEERGAVKDEMVRARAEGLKEGGGETRGPIKGPCGRPKRNKQPTRERRCTNGPRVPSTTFIWTWATSTTPQQDSYERTAKVRAIP